MARKVFMNSESSWISPLRKRITLVAERASLVAQTVKNMPAMWETCFWSLGGEDPLEKRMATHSSILGWRISCKEEPGRLQSMRSWRVDNWATNTFWELRAGNRLWFVWDPAKRIWHSWGPLCWPQTPDILWKGLCQGASLLTPGWDDGMGFSQMLGWVHTVGIYKANTKNIGRVWLESFPTFYFIITSFNIIISEKNFFQQKYKMK